MRLLVALACALMALSGCAGSQSLSIQDPWARITGSSGSVYLNVQNNTASNDALLRVSVDPSVARSVEMHETVTEPGSGGAEMMVMRETERIEIPPEAEGDFSPGKMHVMLVDVQGDHPEGSTISVELQFENAGTKTVEAEVRA